MPADAFEIHGSFLARRFAPELERAFQARYYAATRRELRVAAVLLAALFLVYAGRDYHDTHSAFLTASQNGAPAAFFLLLFALTFWKGFERFWQPIIALGGWIAATLSLGVMASFLGRNFAEGGPPGPPPGEPGGPFPGPPPGGPFPVLPHHDPFPGFLVYFSLQVCILMVCFAAFRLPLRWALALQLGVFGVGVRAFATWLMDGSADPLDALQRFLQSVLLVLCVVLLTAWVQERLARRAFLANHLLDRSARELASANAALTRDLEAAAKVQKALLPRTLPDSDAVHFAWAFRPCQQLAGDILNVFSLDETHIGFYLLDVTGHGVPASLLSVAVSHFLTPEGSTSLLKRAAPGENSEQIVRPREVVQRLNRQFSKGSPNQFFTLFYGILDTATLELRYTNAGHPCPVILSERRPPRWLEVSGTPVGVFGEGDYEESVVQLESGERFWLYSDGLPEARNPKREAFGDERLLEELQAMNSGPLSSGAERLVARVEDWTGRKGPQDDISLVAFEIAC